MPIPDVKKGYVRIKVKATSFNPVDWKIRKGNFGGTFPIVMGHDSAGHLLSIPFFFLFLPLTPSTLLNICRRTD
jgi:hypothetical protein